MNGYIPKRGSLIIFEGCDKAGKSTQCRKIVTSLQQDGIEAELMCFPDRTTSIGHVINGYLSSKLDLDDRAIHLLFSANRWELVPKMREKLNQGVCLIVDRYAYSGVAFSAAKGGMDLDWCCKPDVGLPKPDLVLYLDLSREAAAKRSGYGTERYEVSEFQEKVQTIFEKLKDDTWKIVNADKTEEELHEELLTLVKETIKKPKHSEVGQLWV